MRNHLTIKYFRTPVRNIPTPCPPSHKARPTNCRHSSRLNDLVPSQSLAVRDVVSFATSFKKHVFAIILLFIWVTERASILDNLTRTSLSIWRIYRHNSHDDSVFHPEEPGSRVQAASNQRYRRVRKHDDAIKSIVVSDFEKNKRKNV